ncbi:polysaccharide deacetylase family protein [Sporosarcina sp. Te-1]|uniref:polysaccharide deacetylase family protein n=1 Tax=Sporosarcina sp. Te-1 TaxID=2818390 RepID=UPI001A9D45BB|nr:polysaccharide deacetylase family protein [Sporosarcina sp. Te-1]QTD41471.1 polysaccharide deacetylase family protein [Sporosarcina sp. Te-1]
MRKPRRKIWIDFAFSIAIITLTITAIFIISSPGLKKEQKNNSTNATASVSIESIESTYPGIKIVTEMSNDKKAPYAIQYPQSTHNLFNEKVLSYINDERSNFLKRMDQLKKIKKDPTGELNISFETMQHKSGHYSFVVVSGSNFSDGKTHMTIHSFHLHPSTGAMHTIADVLNRDPENLTILSSRVKEALIEDPSLQNKLTDDYEKWLEPLWSNFSEYALTDEAIIFYLNPQIVTDRTIGQPIVSLSLSSINSLLLKTYQSEEAAPVKTDEHTEKKPEKPSQNDNTKDDQTSEDNMNSHAEKPVSKRVALTFDDGPEPKVTPQILDILKRHDAKATFFMLGSRVEYYPDVAASVQQAGHELGNHTWNHPNLVKLPSARVIDEIQKTSRMIEEVTGQKATAFRPPYGAVNQRIRGISDMPIVLWDVDTLDWQHHDPKKILEKVKQQTKDGSIILMHDIHQTTADGLEAVLTYLENEGYSFVTVSELHE